MSLILDALNRSREDRGEVPGLGSQHQFADNKPDRRAVFLGVALLLALVLIAWLLWERGGQPGGVVATDGSPAVTDVAPPVNTADKAESPPPPVAPEAIERTASPEAVVPAAPVDAVATAPPVEESPDPGIDALYDGSDEAAADIAGEAEANPQADRQDSVQADAAPAPASVPVPANAEPATREQDLDLEQLLRQAENELENARLAEHPAPFVNELSQRAKDGIPTVYYERHEYSGRPGQSRVVLNGKSLKKGGSPVSGMRVEEILPDSVVLDYRGTQFRLRALNSWVNL